MENEIQIDDSPNEITRELVHSFITSFNNQ